MSAPTTSSAAPAGARSKRRRNLLLIVIGIVVIAGIAGGSYGLWYIFIGPSSPSSVAQGPLKLPAGTVTAPASLDGTWNVNTSLGSVSDETASFVGYRVQEQLVGVGGHTAVGRTPKVSGSMTLNGNAVDNVQITADLTALASDNDSRDGQLRRQALETDIYPTATFATTAPIDLASIPSDGVTISATAQGTLTLHGVSKQVTMDLRAVKQGGIIAVAGTLPITFSDYSIVKPTSFSVLSVDDHGTMELHLIFTHA